MSFGPCPAFELQGMSGGGWWTIWPGGWDQLEVKLFSSFYGVEVNLWRLELVFLSWKGTTMAELLGAVTTATKFFFEVGLRLKRLNITTLSGHQVNQISIDNWTFKLFYKATTTILLACSLLSGTKQFFGEPINCDVVRTWLKSTKYCSLCFFPSVVVGWMEGCWTATVGCIHPSRFLRILR